MKKLVFLSALCISLFMITYACNKERIPETTSNPDFNEALLKNLVEEYNKALFQRFGVNTPNIKKGFLAKGSLRSNLIKDRNGQPSLVFLFQETNESGNIKNTKFDFGLDERIEFPEKIEKAQVTFIGNQLIINNFDSNEQINLFVKYKEEVVNKTPSIQTIEGAYLGIQRGGEGELDLRANCDCYCDPCEPGQPCGDESCSCTSVCGGGCSKTCRSGYNAICKDNCDEQ